MARKPNSEGQPTDTPEVIVEDSTATTEQDKLPKPVRRTELPNGVIVEDF